MIVPANRIELVDVIWDLRDAALDAPDGWRVGALDLFQAHVSFEAAEERADRPDAPSWAELGAILTSAANRVPSYALPPD